MSTTCQEPSVTKCDDVFISYNRGDKEWVTCYLLPLLTAANITCVIDERDFPIGIPLDEIIRKLIQECRYTLMVMTPEWVRGKWTNYESELAKDKPNIDSSRILPLKLKDCDVPPNIFGSVYLDISRARTRDDDITKLLRDLGVPEVKIKEALAIVAKKPQYFLVELLTEPVACICMAEVQSKLDEIRHSNDSLTTVKGLHDRLQDLQFPVKQSIELLGDSNPPNDTLNWKRVRDAKSLLREKLESMLQFAERNASLVDITFLATFPKLSEDVEADFSSRNARGCSLSIRRIERQISLSLPRVNDRVLQHVRNRRLRDLVEQLNAIYELVGDIEFDSDVNELLDQFKETIAELVELEKKIQEEADDHGTLQNAEDYMHVCEPSTDPSFDDIQRYWAKFGEFVAALKLTERYGELRQRCQRMSDQLRDNKTVRGEGFEDTVKWDFSDFVFEMRRSFNKLDIDLLADCGDLKPRSDKLNDIFKRMQAK